MCSSSLIRQSVSPSHSVSPTPRSVVGVNRAFSVHVLDGVVDCNEESDGGRDGGTSAERRA